MIQREDVEQVLNFIADRWLEITRDPNSRALEGLPKDFWMNSVGGKTAKGGYWITTAMYTENPMDAEAFKQVLFKWQQKGSEAGGSDSSGGPDLIQIGKKKEEEEKKK